MIHKKNIQNIFKLRNNLLCNKFVWILFFLSFSIASNAQQATVTLDRKQILLGEQVTLQLKVDNINDEAQHVSNWFNIPDTANHIEVISRSKIDTINIDGQSTLIQRITITSFDSGRWTIPVESPSIQDVNGNITKLTFDSAALDILPVDVSHLKDFHPEKSILSVDYTDYTWLYIVGGILLLALLIFLVYKWIKHRKNKGTTKKPIIKGPPLEWAMNQIDALVKEKLIEKGEGKLFFTKLDDICRTYFDERTQSHTMQSTSIEMMEELRKYLIREKDRMALLKYTNLSNSVKFAKFQPAEIQANEAVDIAKETIQNIEKQVIDLKQKNVD